MATPTTLEQITQFTAMRDAAVARMAELMNTAGAAGVTLDEAQSEEYETLATKQTTLDDAPRAASGARTDQPRRGGARRPAIRRRPPRSPRAGEATAASPHLRARQPAARASSSPAR